MNYYPSANPSLSPAPSPSPCPVAPTPPLPSVSTPPSAGTWAQLKEFPTVKKLFQSLKASDKNESERQQYQASFAHPSTMASDASPTKRRRPPGTRRPSAGSFDPTH